jgi:hypothetical protein
LVWLWGIHAEVALVINLCCPDAVPKDGVARGLVLG